MGFPDNYTQHQEVTNLQRERLIGDCMHVGVISRLLQGMPTGTEIVALPPPAPVEVAAPVDTSAILKAMWHMAHDTPFEEIEDTPLTLPETFPEPMKGPLPDVPSPAAFAQAQMPQRYTPPSKEDCKDCTKREYMQEVWDFENNCSLLPWQHLPQAPESIRACSRHVHDLGTECGSWLEAKLKYWETRSQSLQEQNPD